MDENEAAIREHLKRLIDNLAKQLPDSAKVSGDLWKFAKMHDRRSYQLIRFCIEPESDYRTMYKAFVNIHIEVISRQELFANHATERAH